MDALEFKLTSEILETSIKNGDDEKIKNCLQKFVSAYDYTVSRTDVSFVKSAYYFYMRKRPLYSTNQAQMKKIIADVLRRAALMSPDGDRVKSA